MFPQEAESKYKNIITGYGVDDTENITLLGGTPPSKNLFLDVVPGQSEFANLSGFQFS